MRRRFTLFAALTAILAFVLASPLSAGKRAFPEEIALPSGPAFQPEGIAIRGNTFYVGSIPTGAIYRGNLRTGQGAFLVPAQAGRAAIGVFADRRNRLFVAGGGTGAGYVYNATTGANIAAYQFTSAPTFINDVFVTRTGAFFTDSFKQQLYRVPIDANGNLGATAQTIPLTGDISFVAGQFNANGIEGKNNGKVLIIVQSNTGKLFTVSPTGVTDEITLTGGNVVNGDGMLLNGKTLYVVRNTNNEVAVIRLAKGFQSGAIVAHLTNPRLQTPTTVDDHGKRLYVVNARFGVAQPADYWLTQLRKLKKDDEDDDD